MKPKTFKKCLALLALLLLILQIVHVPFSGIFTSAIAFPFEQIGMGLRALSLSGGVGNVIAILFYVIISLLPIAALAFIRKKRRLETSDSLLVLLSILFFITLYLMTNPGFLNRWIPTTLGAQSGRLLLGGVIYSVLLGYLVLQALKGFVPSTQEKLYDSLSFLLSFLAVVFVVAAFGISFGKFLGALQELPAVDVFFQPISDEDRRTITSFFLFLQFVVEAIPHLLNIGIVFSALRLLQELRQDPYSEQTLAEAEHMTRRCITALKIVVVATIVFHLLQLPVATLLTVINVHWEIPLLSILFTLAGLLLTRLVTSGKELKEENDSII
jgi:hypothetical protein